jgi:hypothetical protein
MCEQPQVTFPQGLGDLGYDSNDGSVGCVMRRQHKHVQQVV